MTAAVLTTVYLWVNAGLYLVFALWCTALPEKTAGAVGFDFRSGSGKSEFITVYGGLELAMAVFFAIGAMREEFRAGALLFALLLYACLSIFRVYTLVTVDGIGRLTYGTFALEVVLGLIAAGLWWADARPRS